MLFSTDDALFNGHSHPLIPISMTDRVNNKIPQGSTRLPWPQFVELFEKAALDPYTHKEAAPLWSPTIFLNNHRCHENATDSGVLVLDSDGVATIEQILAIANDLGIECIVHSSGRNGAVIPKWRIIVPLSSLIDRHTYYTATHALFRVLSTMLAPAWTKPAIGCDLSKLHSGDILYVCGTYDTAVGDDKIPFRPINEFHRVNGDIWSADDWIELADTVNPIIVETVPPRSTESTTSQGFIDAAGWDVEVQCADKLALYRGLGSGRHGALYSLACSIANSAYWYRHDLSAADLADILDREQRHNPPASRYDARGLHNAACRAIDGAPAFVGTQRPLQPAPMQVDWQSPRHPDTSMSWWQRETQAPEPEGLILSGPHERTENERSAADVNGDSPFSDTGPEHDTAGAGPKMKRTRKYFDEYLDEPDITYWDADDKKMLPKMTGGYTMLIVGQRGSHKTGFATETSGHAVLHHGAKALYVPCEGERFFGKVRMPAYCDAWGIHPRDLRGRFECVDTGIDLTQDGVAERFIADHSDFAPDIIIIDTLAQATPGVDQNAKAMGDLLAQGGPVIKLRRAFNCIVMILCHPPENGTMKVAGAGSQMNNTEMMVSVTKTAPELITVKVERYKDGPEGTKLFFKVDPKTVPVLVRSDAPDENGATNFNERSKYEQDDLDFRVKVLHKLAELEIGDLGSSLTNRKMCEAITKDEPAHDYKERLAENMNRLLNVQQRKVKIYADSPWAQLTGYVVVGSGSKREWRWWYKKLHTPFSDEDTAFSGENGTVDNDATFH